MDEIGALTTTGWALAVVILLVLNFRTASKAQTEAAAGLLELAAAHDKCRSLAAELDAARAAARAHEEAASYARQAVKMYQAGDFPAQATLDMLADALTAGPRAPHHTKQ